MASNFVDEEKWEYSDSGQEVELEEEEEALSLCDLPVNLMQEEKQNQCQEEIREAETNQEDFDFCSWIGGGSFSTNSEMCAADDIFFQGQILPLQVQVTAEISLNKFIKNDSTSCGPNPRQRLSRSESMIFSSRSSSSRSHNSLSTSSSSNSLATTSTITTKPSVSKTRFHRHNQFHSHPSPKPYQIKRNSSNSSSLAGNPSTRNRKSSVWDFFTLNLVHTPEIELQGLKARSSVSRNSSSSSTNSNSSVKNGNMKKGSIKIENKVERQKNKQSFLQKRGTKLVSGCSCTVRAVKPVPLNIVIVKSSKCSRSGSTSVINDKSSKRESLEKKLKELKARKKKLVEKKQQKQQGKQAMSRHRTFEWIKELSHASYLDDHERKDGEEEETLALTV